MKGKDVDGRNRREEEKDKRNKDGWKERRK